MEQRKFAAGIGRVLLAILLSALAVRALCHVDTLRTGWGVTGDILFRPECPDDGEMLLHGIPGSASHYMPAHAIWQALLLNHWSERTRMFWRSSGYPLSFILIFALGCLLGSLPAGLLSVALMGFAFSRVSLNEYEQIFYTPIIIALACVVVWRARDPVPWKSFLLGAALGASLLFRSVLAFFPPLLAVIELHERRWRWREYAIHLACLCVVPYLFLVPWIWINWRNFHQFIPFEYITANTEILAGALGMVTFGDLDINLSAYFMNPPPSVFGWAVREVLRHPLRYLKAYLARALFAFYLNPALILAALAAVWLYRRRAEQRALALYALYFLGIHCFISVFSAYFVPWWPLLIALASTLVMPLWGKFSGFEDRASYRTAIGVFSSFLILYIGFSLYALRKVSAYPAVSPDRDAGLRALDRQITSYPDDPWLRCRRGTVRLERGDRPGAVEDLSQSLKVAPDDKACSLSLARIYALQGRPDLLLKIKPDSATNNKFGKLNILQAAAQLQRGDRAEARRLKCLALTKWVTVASADIRQASTSSEKIRLERLRLWQETRFADKMKRELTQFESAEELAATSGVLRELSRLSCRDSAPISSAIRIPVE